MLAVIQFQGVIEMKNQEQIIGEVSRIIDRHIDELATFITVTENRENRHVAAVLQALTRLSQICMHPPHWATQLMFSEARHHKEILEDFLSVMNQGLHGEFLETEIGKMWLVAEGWCRTAAKYHPGLTFTDVWKLLAPAEPDYLQEIGERLYETRWWPPVPRSEVESVLRIAKLEVLDAPFEPDQIPGGLAVRFKLRW